ncbi:hypothetical protein QI633_01535 [Nocardioides sp. QY071]|uniref:hypothetical protein n=1 Tax=Nocardioides sp. QY071 TaxID=3044187 RepID=UPI00249A9E62|nr:hypothetical protein [Nocardioides sp. QY071]WGY02450.1 hypothetical protein QI633_01535 [Nocardioides sp. QY071]
MTGTDRGADAGLTSRMIRFAHADPHADQDAGRVLAEVRELEAVAADFYGADAGHRRKRLSRIDLENPATARLVATHPSFSHWISQVPTAAALHPLYEPDATHYPSGVAVDDEIRQWFRNLADARGIRSRAAVMQRLLVEATDAAPGEVRWLSLACGAAQPVFRAMEHLVALGRLPPRPTLADLDRDALRLAQRYAADRGLRADTVRVNVLDRRGFDRLPTSVPGWRRRTGWHEAFDTVDAVGILEYLKPDDWTYRYDGVVSTRRKQAGAITFLRNAYACVRPGGLLVTGNMLDTHPELGFTMDVVQWPHVQPRSVEEVLDIVRAAGILGHVDVHLPTDGVYAVYAIRKP